MKLYQNLLVVVSFLISQFMLAQEGISGRLQDQNEETVPFATVAVMKLPDSTLVTGTTSNMDGEFHLEPTFSGEFVLRLSAIGYVETYTENFKIKGSDFSKNFGVILLSEETTMLDNVMIQTWKPQMRVESDKVVMEIEGTALASGSTALEVLSRAPGVAVNQNGGFSINGKQNVAIMLDGRLTYLSGNDLRSLLESMPAENVKEIEVITNPSAKYDAEGVGGILNINLKKNNIAGTSGSVYAGFKYSQQQLFNSGLNLNHRKGSWNTFFNFDLSERGRYREPESIRSFPETAEISSYSQTGVNDMVSLVPSFNWGADYTINENHSLGANVNFTYQDQEEEWITYNRFFDQENQNIFNIKSQNYSENLFRNGRFNLNYFGQLDTLGTAITADLNYVKVNNDGASNFFNEYIYTHADTSREFLDNTTATNYDIYAGQLDLNLPLSQHNNLEMGVKASNVVSRSNMNFFTGRGGDRYLDPDRSVIFNFEENIYAAYLSYDHRFNDMWNLRAGLRGEQTVAQLRLLNLAEEIDRNYFELFPNVLLEQQVSDNYKISYAYTRRISRPNYKYLNPSIFYLDPYTYVKGNTELQPHFVNSLQLNQTFLGKYNLGLSYDYFKDFIAEVPQPDNETGETAILIKNINYLKNYNANLNVPVELTNFWNTSNVLTFTHQINSVDVLGETVNNSSNSLMFQTNQEINLPGGIRMEVNGTYRGAMAYGLATIDDLWWVDAGFKKSILQDRLDISLRFTDIFRSRNIYVTENYLNNRMVLDQYLDYQAVNLNLRYNFSKGAGAKRKAVQNSLEEMNRAGVN